MSLNWGGFNLILILSGGFDRMPASEYNVTDESTSEEYLRMRLCLVLLALLMPLAAGCEKSDDKGTGPGNGDGNGGSLSGASVSLDHVDGLVGGKIPVDGEVSFYLRLTNQTGERIGGFTNGVRVYSTSGATWTTTTADTTGGIPREYFTAFPILKQGISGSGADTIGLAAYAFTESGLPNGFNEVSYRITIGPVSSSAGRSICIDSSFFTPAGTWLWAPVGATGGKPTWDGPHCYQVGS